jgi:SPP1 gp7 family putative phage head morphogenesis protein
MMKKIEKQYIFLYRKIEKLLLEFDNSKLNYRKKFKILIKKIEEAINMAYNAILKIMNTTLRAFSKDRFLKTLFNTSKNAKINVSQQSVDKVEKVVKQVLTSNVAGKTLTKRINRNNKNIISEVKRIIKKMTKAGKSIPDMAKKLKEKFDIDKNKALRIAWTESHRIKEESTYRGYEEMKEVGIEFDRQWISTLDVKTRDKHRTLDGQIADKEGWFHCGDHRTKFPGGFGVASLDIRCRCTTRQIFPDIQGADTRYVQETGEYIPYKTYTEWAKAYNVG